MPLTKTANELGIATFTLQHGLENVGLSFFDDRHGEQVEFAARNILTWADPAQLPEVVTSITREKCIAVGRSSAVRVTAVPAPSEFACMPIVGVFENLHWHRYSVIGPQRVVRQQC